MFYRPFGTEFSREYSIKPIGEQVLLDWESMRDIRRFVLESGSFLDLKVPEGGENIHTFYELADFHSFAEIITDSQSRRTIGLRLDSVRKGKFNKMFQEAKEHAKRRAQYFKDYHLKATK